MASAPNHAAQGAFITLLAIKIIGWLFGLLFPVASFLLTPLYTILTTTLLTLGAVAGAAPDIIGWIGRIGKSWDWDLYTDAHDGEIAKKLGWLPPYALHLFVDRFFHNQENGGHWWPSRAWLEVALWMVMFISFTLLI